MEALTSDVDTAAARAQLHALAGVLRNLEAERPDPATRCGLEEEIAAAMAAEDERALIAAMRRLASLDRSAGRPVDWTAASGG